MVFGYGQAVTSIAPGHNDLHGHDVHDRLPRSPRLWGLIRVCDFPLPDGCAIRLGYRHLRHGRPCQGAEFFRSCRKLGPKPDLRHGGRALITTFVGYRFVLNRPAPLLAERFQLPSRTEVDARLIGGSALFGIGCGFAGFCPARAAGTGRPDVMIVVAALIAGILAARFTMSGA